MPKLLQLNCTANWGSTGKIAEQIGLCALAHNWESYIAYGRMMNPSNSKLIRVGSTLDVYEHYAENRLLDNEGLASRHATKKLIKEIMAIQPDVVQLHNIHDHYLNYPVLFEYLNRTDIKVVWTFHDCWAFTGHCYHFVTSGCEKWKTECGECPMRNRFYDRSRENFLLKKTLFSANENLTIVPCSEWMAGFVRESFLKNKRIQVIHNGVDLNVFKPSTKNNPDGKFRILAVSNVWPKSKGLADIVKLRGMLPSEYEITVVGLNKKQIESLPIGIKGIQRTQNVQELVILYTSSDVLINTTYADTFPTVNLEALSCGTPVITYRTGGSPEAVGGKTSNNFGNTVEKYETGAVVETGNLEALASTIREFRDTGFKKHHSAACRKRAEEFFDKDKCFEKYVELYKGLIMSK